MILSSESSSLIVIWARPFYHRAQSTIFAREVKSFGCTCSARITILILCTWPFFNMFVLLQHMLLASLIGIEILFLTRTAPGDFLINKKYFFRPDTLNYGGYLSLFCGRIARRHGLFWGLSTNMYKIVCYVIFFLTSSFSWLFFFCRVVTSLFFFPTWIFFLLQL